MKLRFLVPLLIATVIQACATGPTTPEEARRLEVRHIEAAQSDLAREREAAERARNRDYMSSRSR